MSSPGSCIRCSRPLEVESATGLCAECLRTADSPASTPKGEPRGPRVETATSTVSASPAPASATADRTRTFQARVEPATTTAPPATGLAPLPPAPAGYELVRELGSGGMGIVYLARELAPERLVAMKFLQRPGNQAAYERFLVEVRALALLDHPHIIRVLSSDFLRSDPFFTSEYVPGGSLARKVDSGGPFEPVAAARLIAAVARAVHVAHQSKVIHRDLKPSNILLAEDGSPRIADFGLAKRLDRDDGLTTGPGPLGTPRYMAPEQTDRALGEIDARTDVYGLGATLYYLATGQPPFTGPHDESVRQIQNDPPTPPRSLRPDLPRELEAVILKCLEKDAARRYPTAEALADDLDRFAAGQTPAAPLLTWPRRVARKVRRHRRTIAVAALALVAALGLGAIFWPAPDEPTRIRRELAAGRAVTLVGETGPPRWHRWRHGPTALGESPLGDGSCSFESIDNGLLELLDDPGIDRYRITAELRIVRAKWPAGDDLVSGRLAGFYFGQSSPVDSEGRPAHFLASICFNDVQPLRHDPGSKPIGMVRTRVVLVPSRDDKDNNSLLPLSRERKFEPVYRLPGQWRKVRLDVTPEEVKVYWAADGNGEPVHFDTVPRAKTDEVFTSMQSEYSKRYPGVGIVPQPWSPRMPLGIWCHRAAITFRNVVIQPLPPT